MAKDPASVAPGPSSGSSEDEEPFEEEISEEYVSQPDSYNEENGRNCTEQSSEEVDEEETQRSSKQTDSRGSEDTDNRIEQTAVVLSVEEPFEEEEEPFEDEEEEEPFEQEEEVEDEVVAEKARKEVVDEEEEVEVEEEEEEVEEEEEEPFEEEDEEEPFEEIDTLCSDHSYEKNEPPVVMEVKPSSSNENKRSLDTKDVGSPSAKKSKTECFAISKASDTSTYTSEQLQQSASFDKQRRSRWEPQPQYDMQGGESDQTSKKRKTRWAANDSQVKQLDSVELLIQNSQNIIASMIGKNPTFNQPLEHKPSMLQKRVYIPMKEYPGYNFVGLIIGPRGHTQKKMEKETGARILLRGAGSARDEKRLHKPDSYDNEDLHVLIEANNQKSLDDAVAMVEKLLIPVDEGKNEHKRAQLRELAQLNGTLRDNSICRSCSKEGHIESAFPSRNSSILHTDISCDTCGGRSHVTAYCPLTMSTPGKELTNQQTKSFLADLGGAGRISMSTPPIASHIPWQGSTTGFGISTPKIEKEVDDANLLVRYLPQTVCDDRLRELFTPFGGIVEAKVIKDRTTDFSKGYGFVKYDSAMHAGAALACMNGYKIDGKQLAVKVAGRPETPPETIRHQPYFPGPAMVPLQTTPITGPWLGPPGSSWPGPPGSMLPEPQQSVHTTSSVSHHNPVSSPSSLLHFPGNPDYHKSQHKSYFTPSLSSISVSSFSWPPMNSQ